MSKTLAQAQADLFEEWEAAKEDYALPGSWLDAGEILSYANKFHEIIRQQAADITLLRDKLKAAHKLCGDFPRFSEYDDMTKFVYAVNIWTANKGTFVGDVFKALAATDPNRTLENDDV